MKSSKEKGGHLLPLLVAVIFLAYGVGACSREQETPPPPPMGNADVHDNDAGHEENIADSGGEPHRETPEPPSAVKLSAAEQATIGLRTTPATLRSLEDIRLLNGVVKPDPDRIALVASRVAGQAVAIHVKLGDRVQREQDLVDIQSVELEKVELELIQAENRLSLAEADLERTRVLVEKGIVASKNLLAAENQHRAVLNEIQSLTRQLELLGISAAEIRKIRREKTVSTLHLPAPLSGTIVERNVILGQTIEPGQPLFKILDDSVMIVEGDAFEDTLPLLKMGQSVRVRVAAYPQQVFEGQVTFISPTIDPQTRTLHVWTEIVNHHAMLKQDLFADLSVVIGEDHQNLTIPLEALISAEGEEFAFVQDGDVFIRRDLLLGVRDDRHAEVMQGLAAGERVVTDGKHQVYTQYLMLRRGGEALGGHPH